MRRNNGFYLVYFVLYLVAIVALLPAIQGTQGLVALSGVLQEIYGKKLMVAARDVIMFDAKTTNFQDSVLVSGILSKIEMDSLRFVLNGDTNSTVRARNGFGIIEGKFGKSTDTVKITLSCWTIRDIPSNLPKRTRVLVAEHLRGLFRNSSLIDSTSNPLTVPSDPVSLMFVRAKGALTRAPVDSVQGPKQVRR